MTKPTLPGHGAAVLPSVSVDSYNLEIKEDGGFVGDKANKQALWTLIEAWCDLATRDRKGLLGGKSPKKVGKAGLADILAKGEPEAGALVLSAVEEYARELSAVCRRYLRLKEWRAVECIVVGGGFSASRLGKLAVARAELMLKAEDIKLNLVTIRNDPDEAGLLGGLHFVPMWMLQGHNGLLSVDLGGTNFRAGVVKFRNDGTPYAKAHVARVEVWRHGDNKIDREAAARKLVRMLASHIRWAARHRIRLVPLVAISCPGLIADDGSIERGGQNLPGNWESTKFNLPHFIQQKIPRIGESDTLVIMHNDAVAQGLSELKHMQKRKTWGVLTIGTGLGNASFTNRKAKKGNPQ